MRRYADTASPAMLTTCHAALRCLAVVVFCNSAFVQLCAGSSGDCMLALDGIDMSAVPPATLQLPQFYNNEYHDHLWTVTLCNKTTPRGGAACAANGDAYVVENRVSNGACETSWGVLLAFDAASKSITFGQSVSSNNPQWTATVVLSCGQSLALTPTSSSVVVTGPDVNHLNFRFALATSAVCGAAQDGPLASGIECGAGCIFIVSVVGAAYAYVMCVVGYNYCCLGRRGLDLVPHATFWKTFGSLVVEGVRFTFAPVLCCSTVRRSAQGEYEAV